MAILSRKITTYTQNVKDLADTPTLTAAQLKAFFDGRGDNELKTSINGIVDDLSATTDGSSGADQIGATPVKDGGAETVQGILEEIKTDAGTDLTTHMNDVANPHEVTKTQVGLGNCDNTADVNKAVLSATKLATARKIGDADFDGSANISASDIGVYTKTEMQGDGTALLHWNNLTNKPNFIDKTSIADNLTTDDSTKVLSAKQGKVLKDAADTLTSRVTDNEADIAELVPKVDDLETAVSQIDVPYISDDIVGVEVDFENKTFTRISGAVGLSAGANFDKFNAFGGRKRCNLADDGTVNAYFGDAGYIEDGSNGQVMVEQPKFYYKVVPLKLEKNDEEEIVTFKFTAGASADGDITFTLGGVAHTVTVANGDGVNDVATKVRAATITGWTITGATDSAIFTCDTVGVNTPSFSGGTTGVTATVTRTQCGYIGKGFKLRKARYYISMTKKVGFKVHPAFVKNGVEKEKIYLSACEGSLYDVSASAYILDDAQIADFTATTGDKLASIANAKPISGLTQDLTRRKCGIIAENRGTGWSQQYAATAACTQLLFTIEYAALNSQTAIGKGVVDKAGGTGNESEITGATTLLGNASGMAAGTNGLTSITYRGEENFWGNIVKFTDGMNTYCDIANSVHELYVADNTFAESTQSAPYENAGITLPTRNGYVSAMAYNETYDWLFVPAETLGDSALPVGDYFYQTATSNGYKIARLGGDWYHGLGRGAFCWDVSGAPPNRGRTFGGRLVYVPTT